MASRESRVMSHEYRSRESLHSQLVTRDWKLTTDYSPRPVEIYTKFAVWQSAYLLE